MRVQQVVADGCVHRLGQDGEDPVLHSRPLGRQGQPAQDVSDLHILQTGSIGLDPQAGQEALKAAVEVAV